MGCCGKQRTSRRHRPQSRARHVPVSGRSECPDEGSNRICPPFSQILSPRFPFNCPPGGFKVIDLRFAKPHPPACPPQARRSPLDCPRVRCGSRKRRSRGLCPGGGISPRSEPDPEPPLHRQESHLQMYNASRSRSLGVRFRGFPYEVPG